jgi:hypothetical protein
VVRDLVNVYELERKPIQNMGKFTDLTSTMIGKQVKKEMVTELLKKCFKFKHKKLKSLKVDPNSYKVKMKRFHCV